MKTIRATNFVFKWIIPMKKSCIYLAAPTQNYGTKLRAYVGIYNLYNLRVYVYNLRAMYLLNIL